MPARPEPPASSAPVQRTGKNSREVVALVNGVTAESGAMMSSVFVTVGVAMASSVSKTMFAMPVKSVAFARPDFGAMV